MDSLRSLTGTWVGEGAGDFPTIEAFRYRETLRFEFDDSYPLLHYVQRTWLLADDEPSHWESGFVQRLEDGVLEVSNAQNGGRVEVLRGRATSEGVGDLTLELDSLALGNDPRLRRTRRLIRVRGDSLHYIQWMTTWTTETPQMLQHLEARLLRTAE